MKIPNKNLFQKITFFQLKIIFLVMLSSQSMAFAAPKIIGGIEVTPGSPIAQTTVLIIGKIARATFTCTGSIIGNDLVVTAGHCLGAPGYADLNVYFRTQKNGSGPIIHVSKQVRVADMWAPGTEFDVQDVALLKLEKPIPAGYHPVKLLTDSQLLQNQSDIVLAGYGMTVPVAPADGDGGAGVLRTVNQKILQIPYGKTEVLVDIQKKGACFGDSGGPAFVDQGGELYLFGIASRLTKRDMTSQKPEAYGCLVDMVYSNIMAFTDWLKAADIELHRP